MLRRTSLLRQTTCKRPFLRSTIKKIRLNRPPIRLQHDNERTGYDRPIEREWSRKGLGPQPNQGTAQPSLGFGIMAISKRSQDDAGSSSKFQEVTAFFQMGTELILHTALDSINPMQIMNDASEQFFAKTAFDLYIPHNRQTHLGQYTHHPKTPLVVAAAPPAASSHRYMSVPFAPSKKKTNLLFFIFSASLFFVHGHHVIDAPIPFQVHGQSNPMPILLVGFKILPLYL